MSPYEQHLLARIRNALEKIGCCLGLLCGIAAIICIVIAAK